MPYRPGDIILDRYLPSATEEEREHARENLRRLAKYLLRVHQAELRYPQGAARDREDGKVQSDTAHI